MNEIGSLDREIVRMKSDEMEIDQQSSSNQTLLARSPTKQNYFELRKRNVTPKLTPKVKQSQVSEPEGV